MMITYSTRYRNHILLIEDNNLDSTLVKNAFLDSDSNTNINILKEGNEALLYLKKEGKYAKATRPDLIILDLKLPKCNGYEILAYLKNNKNTKCIPVVILTTSAMGSDVDKSYSNYANCYVTKPSDFDDFIETLKIVKNFWLNIVELPPNIDVQ